MLINGGILRRKNKREEEHENLERWLISYSDFITLLFAFFVAMYSISRVDGEKFGSAVESLQRALGSIVTIQMYQKDPGVFSSSNISVPYKPTLIKGHNPSAEARAFEKLAREIKEEVDSFSNLLTGFLLLVMLNIIPLPPMKPLKAGSKIEELILWF